MSTSNSDTPVSAPTFPEKKNKGKESGASFLARLEKLIRDAGGQPKGEYDARLFAGSYPDYYISNTKLAISLVTELTTRKALDLTTLAKADIPHVAIFFHSTLKGSTIGKERGGIVNLLDQDCQRLIEDSNVVAYADHKGKLYAANPYAFPDTRYLEPRMIWKEVDAGTLERLLSLPEEAAQPEEIGREEVEAKEERPALTPTVTKPETVGV